MYVDRILEEKKRLNLSAKTMADTSTLHLSEDTITRILTRKTNDPGVRTVDSVCGTVGLKMYEAFMDATTVAEFRAFREFKNTSDESEAERIRIVAENENLKATNTGLADRLRTLEIRVKHLEELVESKNETIAVYRMLKAPISRED
jgi:transcriptional regulator with XRE-family HTH domain